MSVNGKVKFFNEKKGYTTYKGGFQEISWDEVSDFRNGIVYEIRQGPTWDSGLFIKSQAHPPFVAQGNGTFLIKARCQPIAGLTVYSETAASVAIIGNQLSLNLLAQFDEKASGWTGVFQNGLGIDGGDLRLGGSGNILGVSPLLESLTVAAATTSGNILSFAYVPPTIVAGMAVADITTPGAIPAGAVVLSITYGSSNIDDGTVAGAATSSVDDGSIATSATASIDYGAVTGITATVTINPGVAGGGVLSGDTITFSTPDVLNLGGVITGTPVYYTIPAKHVINAGSVVQASVNATTQIVGVPVGQNILSIAAFLSDSDVLGSASTQYVDGWVEINVSQDGATWAGWQKFVPGVYPGLAWNFRLALQSSDPNSIPYALAFNFAVQLPARIDHTLTNGTVPSGGLPIIFARDNTTVPAPFNGGPNGATVPAFQITCADPNANPGGVSDVWTIAGLTLAGGTAKCTNAGVGVTRNNTSITFEGF